MQGIARFNLIKLNLSEFNFIENTDILTLIY